MARSVCCCRGSGTRSSVFIPLALSCHYGVFDTILENRGQPAHLFLVCSLVRFVSFLSQGSGCSVSAVCLRESVSRRFLMLRFLVLFLVCCAMRFLGTGRTASRTGLCLFATLPQCWLSCACAQFLLAAPLRYRTHALAVYTANSYFCDAFVFDLPSPVSSVSWQGNHTRPTATPISLRYAGRDCSKPQTDHCLQARKPLTVPCSTDLGTHALWNQTLVPTPSGLSF